MKSIVVQYSSWHTGAGTHISIFGILQLEGPGVSVCEESTCNAGDLSSIPGSERPPGEKKMATFLALLPGESHEIAESDMIEQLNHAGDLLKVEATL